MKKIITISREFGAGGGEIGRKVADRLNFEYIDKALVLQAASKINMDILKVLKNDEILPVLTGFGQALSDFYSIPANEQVFEAQKTVIRGYGEHGNCVIVGRNANRILSEFDDSLHVFIHANKYWRVQRLKNERMQSESEEKIIQRLEHIDKKRRKYCSYYTNSEFGDSKYYDLCLNSSKIGIDECVDIICNIAKAE